MKQLGTGERVLAASLAILAGYVDAIGFLALGGFFVSFMSGNTTRMAVGLAEMSTAAGIAAAMIAAFITGVIIGSLTGHAAGARRKPVVLGVVALVLALAAGLNAISQPTAALAAAAVAMGAINAVFESQGDVRFGVTYMTGALVKVGQRLALALRGGDRFAWAPYAVQWLALATGGVMGAMSHPLIGVSALWIAAGAATVLALLALRLPAAAP